MSAPTLRKISENLHEVLVGRLTFWFSYETCIAFRDSNGVMHVCENHWSRTTGKHLNLINTSRVREQHSDFLANLQKLGVPM